jgi:hypothetical protein
LKTYRKNFNVQNDEVEGERQSHGGNQPHVAPRWHDDEGLVLRQAVKMHSLALESVSHHISTVPVHGVQHLNGYKYRQSHGHWVGISEDFAVNALEFISATNACKMVSLKSLIENIINPEVTKLK